MRPLFRLVPFHILGLVLFVSLDARAAEFNGCHNWCGKQANNAWWQVLHSHGLNETSTKEQKAPHVAEANAAKDSAFQACMRQTVAEGKRSDADCDGASSGNENADSNPETGCKAQALEIISQCEAGYSSASGTCAPGRVDSVVRQTQAANEQQLDQSQNANQACTATAQAYQNAASQLSAVQSSCQSSVNQCSSGCERAQAAIQQCSDPEVRAKAQSVATAQQNCSSGELSKRPVEIARASDSLKQVGAGDASRCSQSTAASTNTNPSGSLGSGDLNTSGGRSGLLGGSSDKPTPSAGSNAGGTSIGGSVPSVNPGTGGGSAAINETYNVSGKNAEADSAGAGDDMTTANAALASLPGTPTQTDNGEKTDAQSGAGKDSSASASGASAAAAGSEGHGGGGGRLMFLPRQAGASGGAGAAGTETAKTAGQGGETPDLSAFLPNQRGVAGGVIAGLAGCRIPDPTNPKQCAIPHGPSANIWSEVKERFEILRNAPPPADYFFNEE